MSKLGKILFIFSSLSLVSFGVIRFLLGGWVPFLWVALGLFLVFALASLWLDRKFYMDFLSMKTTRQGMSMGGMIGLVLILVIAVNLIGIRKYWTFDFSLAQVNTLSDQSVKLVKGLKDDLRVIYFYKNGTEGVEPLKRAFTELMKKYQDQSSRIFLEFIEINERPDLTDKYNVKQGTQVVIMEFRGRQTRLENVSEQEVTSAIVKVTREKEKKVYLMTGHGELSWKPSKDGASLAQLRELLFGNRYKVDEFSFNSTATLPADVDILLIPGPKMNFLDVEVRAIEDFLKKGGCVLLSISPGFQTGLEALLKKVGVRVENNYIASVLDTPVGMAIDPRFTRGSRFSGTHEVTKPFSGNQFALFRLPTALGRIEKVPEGIQIEDLVSTSENSMGFADTKFDKQGAKGPFVVGMAVRGELTQGPPQGGGPPGKEFNLFVFGDSNFMNDQYLYKNLNRDLVLNSLAFLSRDENLISISPKEVETTTMQVTETQLLLFIFGFIIPLPLILFASAVALWYRRRYA